MKIAVVLILALLIAVPVVAALFHQRLARDTDALVAQITGAPAPGENSRPPEIIRATALRQGAVAGAVHHVALTQRVKMILSSGGGWVPMTARQWIAVGRPGFVWHARVPGIGPVARFTVVDAYVEGQGRLVAALAGVMPVARLAGAELDRSEAMRYLAELPWAPDAMLTNPQLIWTVEDDRTIAVSLPVEGGRDAVVRLTLDVAGDIVAVDAPDRPARMPDGTLKERAWRGEFSDYAEMAGRRIPLRGLVGYVEQGVFEPYWRGEITSYTLHR